MLRVFLSGTGDLGKLAQEDKPDVPFLSRNVSPIKWRESIKDSLSSTSGAQKSSLSFIICESDKWNQKLMIKYKPI